MTTELTDVVRAAQILRGQDADLAELMALAERLKGDREMGLARKLLARARGKLRDDPSQRRTVIQQHALCTYKDPDLPVAERLERALEMLEECEDLRTTTDRETLGLAGAISKRMWEVNGQKVYLERSLGYYLRGHRQCPGMDYGHTGIKAAYVLDVLAAQDAAAAGAAGIASDVAAARTDEARKIRAEVIARLLPLRDRVDTDLPVSQWWFFVTLAEAYFGIGEYEEARSWLARARVLSDVKPWEFETTAQQLASLARLRVVAAAGLDASDDAPSEEEATAWDVLHDFLGDRAAGVDRAFIGKVGLALSGGGFRASLFHIGVLAYLAERDVLRRVEVLSCVSGGSIVGAHYYLEVRKLLQRKSDKDITAADYIEIVGRVAREFLAGVQRNLRIRLLAHLPTNLKLLFLPGYSRSQRIGELFERELFRRVADGEEHAPRMVSGLFVQPPDEPAPFKPKYENWRRRAKVPILVLNATTLNTGHNWQFTASWMGEPAAGIDGEVDGNYRLRRLYYQEAPKRHQRVRLGHAVAASACVPGLFEPLIMERLYPDRTVRLVDGGVHDNQGTASLLEQDCTVLLVSDATGQMATQDRPSGGLLGVSLRASGILMARVRQAQYRELDSRRRSGLLRGLMFVHLKKDLDADPVDWVGCDDPNDASDEARPIEHRGVLTRYGVRKEVQQRLASIRTDLDSFSDAEAYGLMMSGYRMANREFDQCIEGFPARIEQRPEWSFLAVEPHMSPGQGYERFLKLLDVARKPALKIWYLSPILTVTAVLLGVAAGVAAGFGLWYLWQHRNATLLRVGTVLTVAAVAALTIPLGSTIVRAVRWRQTVTQALIGFGLSVAGWLFAGLHLLMFDRLYLAWGRLDRFGGGAPSKPDHSSGAETRDVTSRLDEITPEPVAPKVRPR